MKIIQYLTSEEYGCCKTAELLALSRQDKANGTHDVDDLKKYAREEMTNRGIEITE